jgi:basic amino acid/polyamine antiporter, APA family
LVYTEIHASRGKLKRELGLYTLVAVMIGLNIGGSLFVLTAIGAGITGPSLIIAQLLSALPVLLALVPYLVLTSAMPTTCANYQYAKLFSRPLAIAGWMGLFVAIPIGALPLFALATASFLNSLVPGVPPVPTAIAVMTFFFIVNILGIRAAAYLQFATVILLLAALFIFIVPGIPAVNPDNLTPMYTGGLLGFVAAAALLYTLLAGGMFGIEVGDEVKNARRTIPRALVISVAVVLVIYLLIEFVAVGVVDYKVLGEAQKLDVAAAVFLDTGWFSFFVIGGGILAATTTINLTMTAAGRYVLAAAEDKFLPRFFGQVNRRFGTPHWGLTLAYGISIVVLIIGLFTDALNLTTLATMLNFGLLFMVTLVVLAAIRLPGKYPEIFSKNAFKFSRRTILITGWAAVTLNIIFMLILVIALPRLATILFAAAIIIGLIIYFVCRRRPGFAPAGIAADNKE